MASAEKSDFPSELHVHKARKTLFFLIWLQVFPPEPNAYKAKKVAHQGLIASLISGFMHERCSSKQVNGFMGKLPFPRRTSLSQEDRQALVDVIAKRFSHQFAGTRVMRHIPDWYFSVSSYDGDAVAPEGQRAGLSVAERSEACKSLAKFLDQPVGEAGRGRKPQIIVPVNENTVRDLNSGNVEYCQSTSILADKDNQEFANIRCDIAETWRAYAEQSQSLASNLGSASLELGGRVQPGSKNITKTMWDGVMWRNRIIRLFNANGFEKAIQRLDQVFVQESISLVSANGQMIQDRKFIESIKFPLDAIACDLGIMKERQFIDRWHIAPLERHHS